MPCSTDHNAEKDNVLFYTGASMHPTLKPGDELRLIPCAEGGIHAGDIVVFRPRQSGGYYAHRVVVVTPEGITTRGDNNSGIDPWRLNVFQVLGRVGSVRRDGAEVLPRRGFRSRLAHAACRIRMQADALISRMLRPAYRRLARPSAAKRLLWRTLPLTVTAYERCGGLELHLLFGKRVIGRRMPGEASWTIRRPFRIVCDESFLSAQRGPASLCCGHTIGLETVQIETSQPCTSP